MKLISTQTLVAAAASISFTSIPQTFTDLVVISSCRTNRAATGDFLKVNINGSGANQTSRSLYGTGAEAIAFTSSVVFISVATSANQTANTFGNSTAYIPNYAGATNKIISLDGVSENNATAVDLTISSGLWSQTAAITSLEILSTNSATLQIGSTISLYGITKGSDGIVTTS
jgi:hypothetical protein